MATLPENNGARDVQDKDISKDMKRINQELVDLSLKLLPPKWDTFRIAQELVGIRMQKERPRKMEQFSKGHGSVFSFGNKLWTDSEKYPKCIPTNYLLEDIRKKMEEDKYSTHKLGKVLNNPKHVPTPFKSSGARLNNKFGFTMIGDCHRAVRNYLKTIGWHEKFMSPVERQILIRALQKPTCRESTESTKFISQNSVDFIWAAGYINWCAIHSSVVVSRIPAASLYFSKISLSTSLKSLMPFIYKKNARDVRIPRTYEIRGEEDLEHFSKNFRINACICMLKNYYFNLQNKKCPDNEKSDKKDGTVTLDCVDFAVKRVAEFLQFVQHDDLDDWTFSIVSEEDWGSFLFCFEDMAYYNSPFKKNNNIRGKKLSEACQILLDHLYELFPEMKYEGMFNLWIIKPANGSCGRGVRIFRNLEDIYKYCHFSNNYVIQKYIEMPLLIYKTKFDIRQWFVITSVTPLIIWMYDECYLRFCSQEFSLKELHESVHLCNNTIQWKYKNGVRDHRLPDDNMWDNNMFAEYLRNELKTDQWLNIQDQMKQAIIASCIATQEKMFHRPNSFHLYGADFMLTPDFQVWLIEINCTPSMKYSTSITTRMCKAVLEDTLKVGLERKFNPSVPTGKFKEIYRQTSVPAQIIFPFGRILEARRMKLHNISPTFSLNGAHSNSEHILNEPIANYSKIRVKHALRRKKPLDPGDTLSLSAIWEYDSEGGKENIWKRINLNTQTLSTQYKKDSLTKNYNDYSMDKIISELPKIKQNKLKSAYKKETLESKNELSIVMTSKKKEFSKSRTQDNEDKNYKLLDDKPSSSESLKQIAKTSTFAQDTTCVNATIESIFNIIQHIKDKEVDIWEKKWPSNQTLLKNLAKNTSEKMHNCSLGQIILHLSNVANGF